MKTLKALSLLAVLVTLTVISNNLYKNFAAAAQMPGKKNIEASPEVSLSDDSLSNPIEEKFIESPVNIQVLSVLLQTDTSGTVSFSKSNTEKNDVVLALFEKMDKENKKLKEEITALKNSQGNKNELNGSFNLSNSDTQMFLAKAVFSFLFCISALYVVLSNKYDEDKTKWAFSVLSLIAGVWIGQL